MAQATGTDFLNTPYPIGDLSGAITIISADGVIRFTTPATAAYFGYRPEEIIGHNALRFAAPESRETVRVRWLALRDDPSRVYDTFPLVMQTAQGRRIPIRASVWRLPGRDEFLVLHHVIERVSERLATLYAVQTAVAATLDVEQLIDTVLREAHRLIPCAAATFYVLERDESVLVRRRVGDQIEHFRSPLDEHLPEFITSKIMRETGRPVLIKDTETDSRWTRVPHLRPIRSWLGAPLIHAGQFMGELTLDSPDPYQFTEEDAELVHALATQVAAALHSARQYQDEQRRAERFRVLNEVSLAISQLGLRSVLELVYQNVSRLMDTSTFFIGLLDAEANVVHLMGSYDFGQPRPDEFQSADAGITGLVLRTRQPLIVHDTAVERLPPEVIIQDEMPRSILMMPLIAQDEIVGVISVQSYKPHSYSQDDIDMLETIAGAVAIAVRNARLYDQTVERLRALETLHKMSLELAVLQDPRAVASAVARAAAELFAPDEVRLYLGKAFKEDGEIWLCGAQALTPAAQTAEWPALVSQALASGETVFVTDVEQEDEQLRQAFGGVWAGRAGALMPVTRSDTTFAVLVLLWQQPHLFRSDMCRILDLFCLQAATAFENASYTLKLRRNLEEVSALHELARRASELQNLQQVLDVAVHTVREVYQCYSASIALLDEASQEVVTVAGANLPPEVIQAARFKYGEYVSGEVVATGRAIYVPDTYADPNFRIIDPNIRSLLVIPLIVRGRTIGSLGIDSERPNAFTPDHERVLTIAGGQIAAAIEMLRLLEETRQRANELAEANRQLQAQDALRRELIYQVSHDLRSPLQIVYGYAGMLYDGDLGPTTAMQREVLDHIIRRSKAIEQMTQDIMAAGPISREGLQLGPVNLSELCTQVVNSARVIHRNRAGLTFQLDLECEALTVEGDYNRLTRVLDNLIGNAVKFSPDGGTITVRLRTDETAHCALVSVSDQGVGIAREHLPYLFERFYRAHRGRFGGSGLGLYNVQQIIQAHHGQVWVESEEGRGSTFTFSLPLPR